MNSINVIMPYKWNGLWVFDDEAKGLDKELFVSGADLVMDVISREIPDAHDGFVLCFSETEFPGASIVAKWKSYDGSGNWYELEIPGFGTMCGWLCPALLKYFDAAPKEIHLLVKEREN